MATSDLSSARTISIDCRLNKASLGNADYVFAIIQNIFDNHDKVAWVPRNKLTIKEQPLLSDELNAQISVELKQEEKEKYIVSILNSGSEEIIEIDRRSK